MVVGSRHNVANESEVSAANIHLARPGARDIEVISQYGDLGRVIKGCTPSKGGSVREIDVATGVVEINGAFKFVAAATVTLAVGHATLHRIDLVTINSAGVVTLTAGANAAIPLIPAIPANSVPICIGLMIATATDMTTNEIVDKRMRHGRERMIMDRSGLIVAKSLEAAEVSLYSHDIPGGLLGTNSALKLTIGGKWLNNDVTTRTTEVIIKLGATTLFDYILHVAAPSANLSNWKVELDIIAGNSDAVQQVLLHSWISDQAAANNETVQELLHRQGTANATLDSTVNQTLDFRIDHSASHAFLSINYEYVLLEYIP